MAFSEEAVSELRSLLDESIISGNKVTDTPVAGANAVIVDKNGNELFTYAAGKRGIKSKDPMGIDSIFWIASSTKMITGIAIMQAVERGLLELDNATQTEELVPEFKTMKVLNDDGTVEEKKNGITLRMLLTHTAGFSYSFFDPAILEYTQPLGLDETTCNLKELLKSPLRFQPGEKWKYGINMDWAGVVLERRTGKKLGEWMQGNIFGPLGLENIRFNPTQAMKDKLVHMHQREKDGTLRLQDHIWHTALQADTPEEIARINHQGGAGLFADSRDYARIISVLLNDGVDAKTGHQLLSKPTIDEMFKNQVPDRPDFGRQLITSAKPDLANTVADLYPIEGRPPQGWGLSFMFSNANPLTGRSAQTVYWAGMANTYWWADREHGVGGVVAGQVLPFPDLGVATLWTRVEMATYKHLKKAGSL
ncbi:hypothetical protein M426DRAFT_316304 [Hypoxylon sp. CI-4A]|nr:hypothetical protein M426DRAFT_316304 [Hypoxylon sp. CI-4A]